MGIQLILNWKTVAAFGAAVLMIILGTKLDSEQSKEVLNTMFSNQWPE